MVFNNVEDMQVILKTNVYYSVFLRVFLEKETPLVLLLLFLTRYAVAIHWIFIIFYIDALTIFRRPNYLMRISITCIHTNVHQKHKIRQYIVSSADDLVLQTTYMQRRKNIHNIILASEPLCSYHTLLSPSRRQINLCNADWPSLLSYNDDNAIITLP